MDPKWHAELEEIKQSKSDDPVVLFRAYSREKFILDQVQREADAYRRGREKIAEQMVLNTRKMNFSKEPIAEATGFSMEQVQRIVQKKSK